MADIGFWADAALLFAMKSSVFFFISILLCEACAGHTEEANLDAAWREAAEMRVPEALKLFEPGGGKESPGEREAKFGVACAILNLQPKVGANIGRAEQLLKVLASEEPGDDWAILAKYFLARIVHVHSFEPDPVQAEKLYRELYSAHPDSPIAQFAVAKMAVLNLCVNESVVPLAQRYAALEAVGEKLTVPTASASFHCVMGNVALDLELGKEKALVHFLRAEEIGIPMRRAHADVLLQISLLSEELGHRFEAVAAAERFIRENPRDSRSYTLAEQVQEWRAKQP